jgi:hypothetical protein
LDYLQGSLERRPTATLHAMTETETLYDIIADWWDEIFLNNNEAAETIESLVDRIEKEWLPKPQSAAGSQNAYVECSVEGFNDCLTKIKGKLR